MLRRAAVLKRICDRRRAQNATSGSIDNNRYNFILFIQFKIVYRFLILFFTTLF